MSRSGGRLHAPTLVAIAHPREGEIELRSPTVGAWRDAPAVGDAIASGGAIGALEVLGVVHALLAPADAAGTIVRLGGQHRGQEPVAWDDLLLVLDPRGIAAVAGAATAGTTATSATGGATFRAPTSGRYYGRPAPDKPPFVAVGDILEPGRTICMLEVMKTFNRVTYAPTATLPDRARITAILPREEEDLTAGTPILTLEPA
jgi:acetyl-CoA carboxylase biotin carboxyl carrier protein